MVFGGLDISTSSQIHKDKDFVIVGKVKVESYQSYEAEQSCRAVGLCLF